MPEKIIIVTNLYPLPWQPTRATFNYQQFSELSKHLEVYILIPVAFPDWFKNRKVISKDNSRVMIVPYLYFPKMGRRFYSFLMYWSLWLMAGRWVQEIAPSKILGSWAYPDGVAAHKIAQKINADFYLKVHGSDINMHASYPSRAKQIVRVANNAKGILSVSSALASRMTEIGVDKSRIQVIYNGVNLEKFIPIENSADNETPYILFIGNLIKDKGVLELLDSYEILYKKNINIELRFIGGGPMMSELKRRVKQKNLTKIVKFLGIVSHDELPKHIAKSNILALPSYREGVPNVILEAMSRGLIIIASDVGAVNILVSSKNGVLIENPKHENILTAMNTLLKTDAETLLKMKKFSVKLINVSFTWEKVVNYVIKMISSSLKN